MQEGSLTTRDNNTPPPNARIKHAVVVSYSPRVESVNRVDVGLRNVTPGLLSHKRAQPRKINEQKCFFFLPKVKFVKTRRFVSRLRRTQHFKQSIMFMHESRLKGEGCLVHCLAGVSRSVTLVVAYIMTVTRLGWSDALAAVKAARPCAAPNVGFQRQLQEFESTQADKQFREWLQMEYKDNPFNDEAQIRDLLVKVPKANSDAEETKKESSSQP
ncbi:dual specificity protein phosphatase 22-B isoform X1 [Takifugu rubripes]|uniref:dual specificity protein phosphatase 22-B isoform X1 n=1 Tax=Takifugu rubripes TaxID=31033 RepID=UPI001145DA9C|nr:dual specificity protein phosphatase 22-B-like isoform X1 [Takifugu rubripes]XP_029686900.1 dual specificity protein phosphatase 22-B-like isoform X1 [Takifugu rubripes]XP_029686901.1 dual specificity protein phosphatase 22-B-like isoform X1 [Takifugu rubripes]XP_029686902.1 dual specificity protein phosphatase 22-B-like isoform X1 [Takifugu rubripes]